MLEYMVLDVDGTLTDGSIYYDDNGNEIKKFCTKDGTGIVCARTAGIKFIILTGRECKATERRMQELKIDIICQNIKNKIEFLKAWIAANGVEPDKIGYIGDDINDLGAMKLCGFIGCPADAAVEVKEIADYVSSVMGGHGAVRDVIEHYLRKVSVWTDAVNKAYGAGV